VFSRGRGGKELKKIILGYSWKNAINVKRSENVNTCGANTSKSWKRGRQAVHKKEAKQTAGH